MPTLRSLRYFLSLFAISVFPVAKASAQLLQFQINVTSASGVAGFSPFSFGQTITYLSPPFTSPLQLFPAAGNLLKTTSGANVSFSDTPQTQALLSTLGLVSLSASLYAEEGFYLDFNSGIGQIRLEKMSVQLYQLGGLWHYDTYYSSIGCLWMFSDPAEIQTMTFARIVDRLTQSPVLWTEFASVSISTDSNGFNRISDSTVRYSGTATLLPSAVPEPATYGWLGVGALAFTWFSRRQRQKR